MKKFWLCLSSLIIFFLFSCIVSCKNNDKNKTDENEYSELIKYLNEIRNDIITIPSKPVFYIDLKETNFRENHKMFLSDRLDYFIAILEKNETAKKEYYDKHYQHSMIFWKYDVEWGFIDCIDTFDYLLFDRIENKFNGIKIQIEYIKEYKMTYRYMINQENGND